MKLPHWTPSAEVGFQTCHVLAAMLIGACCQLLGLPWYRAWEVTAVWVLLKEWGFDLLIERDTPDGSLTDAFWYFAGALVWTLIRGAS